MSVIQQHTAASLSDAWRTINVDALTEDSSVNFDTSTLQPASGLPETSEADARQINAQVRQLLRGATPRARCAGASRCPCTMGARGPRYIFLPLRGVVVGELEADQGLAGTGSAPANGH